MAYCPHVMKNRFVRNYTHKEVNWSYPTSPNAVKFGFSKSGCFTLSVIDRKDFKLPKGISGHPTREQAIDAGIAIDLPWMNY